jgi:hypothetical protein
MALRKNRKYSDRWKILVQGGYNPLRDVFRDENMHGILRATDKCSKNMLERIREYFFERKFKGALSRTKFINFCGFGELLLMPNIEEFLDYINHNIPHVNKIITTNGSTLSSRVIYRTLLSKYNIQISLLASKADISP